MDNERCQLHIDCGLGKTAIVLNGIDALILAVWTKIVERMKRSNVREIMLAQTPEDFLEKNLSTFRTPTLLLWGSADRVMPVEEGKAFHQKIVGSIYREVSHCGHIPQKECPLDLIRGINQVIQLGAF